MKKAAAVLLAAGLCLTGCAPAPVWSTPVDVASLEPGELAVVDGVTVMATADGKQVPANPDAGGKLMPQFNFTYPGSELGVSGKGWRAGEPISVSLWNSAGTKRLSERTQGVVNPDGTFTLVHQIGALPKGKYVIKAGQAKPADVASAKIEIREP